MPNKDTTPLSLYGNDREYLREQEKTNELLADIAGEEYESPGDIPNGKYVIQKRLLDATQKKNELLESIADGGGTGGGAAKAIGIDYATDVISLKNKAGDVISGSGATLPAYGVSFDPTTGGLTLTKNGTAVSGQTVTIPNYGSPVGVTSSSDMTDHDTIYLYEGTTSGSYTKGHFYYWDGTAWADGGEYAAATVQTDKTLLVEDRAADAKATGEAVSELKTQIEDPIIGQSADFVQGYISGGTVQPSNRTVVTKEYFSKDTAWKVRAENGCKLFLYGFDSKSSAGFRGYYNTSNVFSTAGTVKYFTEIDLNDYNIAFVRIAVQKYEDETAIDITPSDVASDITFINSLKVNIHKNTEDIESADATIEAIKNNEPEPFLEWSSVSGTLGVAFDVDMPAGTYRLDVGDVVSSDTDLSYSSIKFQQGNNTIILSVNIPRGEAYTGNITLPANVNRIAFYAKSKYGDSAGYTFEYTDVLVSKYTELNSTIKKLEDVDVQNDYNHAQVSFDVQASTGLDTRKLFDVPLPAGKFSISVSGIIGRFYVSLVGKTGTVLTSTQTWAPNVKEHVTTEQDVYGVAVFVGVSWQLPAAHVVVDVLRENRITHDEDLLALTAKIPVTNITKIGNTLYFSDTDNTAGIQTLLSHIYTNQKTGRVYLPNGVYSINTPVTIGANCIMIEGEIWNYPNHPNGVVPSTNGTVLSLDTANINGITLNSGNGICIYNIGIVKTGWDTRGLFDRSNPAYYSGIVHKATYSDQIDIRKDNFTGLAAAFCVSSVLSQSSNVDASSLHDCNMDGCDIGIIIDGRTTIYSKWFDNLIADTGAYGIFMSGNIDGVTIKGNTLVRNAGAFSNQQKTDFANEGIFAVYIANAKKCIVSDNVIHRAGTFYDASDSENPVYSYDHDAGGLYFSGEDSTISGNSIHLAQNNSMVIAGNHNTITGNYAEDNTGGVILNASNSIVSGNTLLTDGNYSLIINGSGNSVSGNMMNKKIKVTGNNNTIVCSGKNKIEIDSGATGNVIIGFATTDITDNGTDTVIR